MGTISDEKLIVNSLEYKCFTGSKLLASLSFKPGVDGHEDAREESERETENSRVDHSLVVEVDFEPAKESRYKRWTLEPASYCRCFTLSMETLLCLGDFIQVKNLNLRGEYIL